MSENSLDDVRDRLVLAALNHIPFDGWSEKALRYAAKDEGLDPDAPLRAFPHGVTSAVEHFTKLADRLMVEDLEKIDLESMPVQERVFTAIKVRLTRWAPHQEAVRRALSVYALPQNVGLAGKATLRTVDAIWKACGDTSADFNWYTKRASLAAIYSATLLYWLDDSSEDFEETWGFLHRRLGNLVDAIKMRKRITDSLARLPNPFRMMPRGLRPRSGHRTHRHC